MTDKTLSIKSIYERRLLEMLLRHSLPKDCEIEIEIAAPTPKSVAANFSFSGDQVKVDSNISDLRLSRSISTAISDLRADTPAVVAVPAHW